jgi:pimeloyl-ACP methyl ester carboxylesterase
MYVFTQILASSERPLRHSAVERQSQLMQLAASRHMQRLQDSAKKHTETFTKANQDVVARFRDASQSKDLTTAWSEYCQDAFERSVLTLDALRKRGDNYLTHVAARTPPVLIYDYEMIVDGEKLPRPCNYILLKILPPEGVEIQDHKRPYVIIDPRAGHGPGIGGFKPDSQVGVALKGGHPVYFIAFRPVPHEEQTLASVTHAEAGFLREIMRRHPQSPKPIIIGNCQGGWATAILAATNPDLTGPIVLNGSPMSYWSGRLGQDPMRYAGGMAGGVFPAMLLSDLGGGLFDGAHLVSNFEGLNPANTKFRKYYDLYANIDGGDKRFLDFERWWGGFFLMNEAEIRWIVENLFVGNKLGKNEARLETGRSIDLKAIRAPIIVFASHGDNITPPAQALNWIIDTYADESEIEIRGQRIIYMVHDDVGHLGIFVSSDVAKREHTQMASTLKTIESLAPGLYEMCIEDSTGEGHARHFTVSFQKRRMSDLLAIGDGRDEEYAFAAVARMSENLAEVYETAVRPVVKTLVTSEAAAAMRAMHPLRSQRTVFTSQNPMMMPVAQLAEKVRGERHAASKDNPFLALEQLWADGVEAMLQTSTDMKAFWTEMMFLGLYAGPWGDWYGEPRQHRRTLKSTDELRALPEVADALANAERGGLAEAVVRMMILLADSRGNVRRDRLERSNQLLTSKAPFVGMDPATRSRMIHQQTLIAHFEPDIAMSSLVKLLPAEADRAKAVELVEWVLGDASEMAPRTTSMMASMKSLFQAPARPLEAKGPILIGP